MDTPIFSQNKVLDYSTTNLENIRKFGFNFIVTDNPDEDELFIDEIAIRVFNLTDDVFLVAHLWQWQDNDYSLLSTSPVIAGTVICLFVLILFQIVLTI